MHDPHAWRADAACHQSDLDPDTWLEYPAGKAVPVEAMRICVACPVRMPCLEYALSLSAEEDTGVWGGTSEKGRREIRHGRLARHDALDQGDQVARRRSREEILSDEEPWLLEKTA